MPPQWSYLILPAHVPDIEFGIFVSHRLDVEADCGDCGDVLVQFELIEDR